MCVRVTTNHSNISSSFVSVHPSSGACLQQRENPLLAAGRTSFSFKLRTQVRVLDQQCDPVRKCNDLLIKMLEAKLSLHFRTLWCTAVLFCPEM